MMRTGVLNDCKSISPWFSDEAQLCLPRAYCCGETPISAVHTYPSPDLRPSRIACNCTPPSVELTAAADSPLGDVVPARSRLMS
jgi:hypothetical protein